jgi:hypothetical protein
MTYAERGVSIRVAGKNGLSTGHEPRASRVGIARSLRDYADAYYHVVARRNRRAEGC